MTAFFVASGERRERASRATAKDRQNERANDQALPGAIVSSPHHKEQSLWYLQCTRSAQLEQSVSLRSTRRPSTVSVLWERSEGAFLFGHVVVGNVGLCAMNIGPSPALLARPTFPVRKPLHLTLVFLLCLSGGEVRR